MAIPGAMAIASKDKVMLILWFWCNDEFNQFFRIHHSRCIPAHH